MHQPQEVIPSESFKKYPRLKILFINNCGKAISQNYRLELRSLLVQALKANSLTYNESELLELSRRPQHADLSISLSHSETQSLIGWVDHKYRLGVDIENCARLQLPLLQRVCSPLEISNAPDPELLWSAKEAVFKSLAPQIKVLSFVEIFDWEKINDTTWTYKAREAQSHQPYRGEGEVCLRMKHCLAFFINNP